MLVIVNFGQVVDLERGGEFSYQLTVMLPNGTRVPIGTDEETVRQLMELIVEPDAQPRTRSGNNHPQPRQPTINEDAFRHEMARIEGQLDDGDPSFEPDVSDDGEIFGGDYDPEGLAAAAASSIASEPEPVMGVVASQPMPTPQPQAGLGQGPRIRVDSDGFALPPTARTVQADEKGYPIVPGRPQEPNIPDDDGEDDGTQM